MSSSFRQIFNFDPGRFFRLARKELRETLRDRRTILTLVLMPLFVYPLLGVTFQKFFISQLAQHESREESGYLIAFESPADEAWFQELITRASAENARANRPALDPPATWLTNLRPSLDRPLEATIREGRADIALRRDGDQLTLILDPQSTHARAARLLLEQTIAQTNANHYQRALRRFGRSVPPAVTLASVQKIERDQTTVTLATVIPFILLLMTATGAVYPAIDLTAGERERGTLEALAAAPVSREAILAAKYVAVFCVSVLTAAMNLAAMAATAYSIGLDQFLFPGGLGLPMMLQVFGLVLVLAAFFSAFVLLITSFARSFKEAQAYLVPLMMLALAPGIVSLMPELRLSIPLAVTPLVGIVLLARDVLTTGTSGLLLVACIGSTLLYAAVALLAAARAFGTDAVLYGSAGTWRDLFQRPTLPRPTPPVTTAIATLALLFPLFLLLGPLPGRLAFLNTSGQLLASALLSIGLFALLPAVAANLARCRWSTTFAWRAPHWSGWAAGLLLGLSMWVFAFEMQLLFLSQERFEAMERLFSQIQDRLQSVPFPLLLLTLALIQPVCEEFFFRGFLLSALRDWFAGSPSATSPLKNTFTTPALLAILATGLLFGLFHVIVREGLFLERMIPTTLLGFILGFIRVGTGSLWPGILAHVLHNSLMLSLSHFQQDLSAWGWTGGERDHLPLSWIATATFVVAIGTAFLSLSARRRA